ncbi:hypothetical protein QN379_14125 [Glaciimonas sp. Gout2]|uniref:hypothetical protein n=1 Tax=unclassified Glaciimonas TaxID=2644401 RepID=UPI002B23AD9D|nr:MULTISPECIES: hypothetical protein [unclassified Glaciimonas]MEB0013944.1 hypothetical protein [Glaciimonas sp. Cout2]MEB0083148.1 hypothetical protein [Glaciimonas sp. Gout2]
MNLHFEVAQRLDSYDNQSLVDYFPIHLPCQILVVDIVGIEHRKTPAVTEFILLSICAGLTTLEKISGLLGLSPEHCSDLMNELISSEYIGTDSFGGYALWRRGSELLQMGEESAPIDRRMHMVWDPICKKFLGRVPMYTKKMAARNGIIVPLAGVFNPPDLNEVGAAALKEAQLNASGGRNGRPSNYDVLRVTTVHKSMGRYREALAMVYRTERGEFSLRIVTNDNIDDELTTACAQASIAKLVGVDKSFSSRQGALAVRKRLAELPRATKMSANLEGLVRRRSIFRFKIATLDARLVENDITDLKLKREIARTELVAIDFQLEAVAILPVRCHEIRTYILAALRNAHHHVLITTTMPTADKFDNEIFGALQECIARKVKVSIYISDRQSEDGNILARIDKLSKTSFLNVRFLTAEARPVFEVEYDLVSLCFSNEPGFGNRRAPIMPREFTGYFVSDSNLVKAYSESYLDFKDVDFIKHVRVVSKDTA